MKRQGVSQLDRAALAAAELPADRRRLPGALRSVRELATHGLVAPEDVGALSKVAERYSVAITPGMAELVPVSMPVSMPGPMSDLMSDLGPDPRAVPEPVGSGPTAANGAGASGGGITDPIALQFLPDIRELDADDTELSDPIGDEVHAPVPGIVHRYPDRVLLKPLSICPVYCRFCFRRAEVGESNGGILGEAELGTALSYIANHPEVWEVVVTGGDPLLLSARRLAALMQALADVPHVKVVRLHTRVPVVDPTRIDADLLGALLPDARTPGMDWPAVYVAVHTNHAREFTEPARRAVGRLANAGIPLLGQTVLLANVNDNETDLALLMRTMVENRIKPYYLHHLDRAEGTARFRTTVATGRALVAALRGRYSGLCQPTYVLDIPGGYGKSPLTDDYLKPATGSGYWVYDYLGNRHWYPEAVPRAFPSLLSEGDGNVE